MKIQEESTMEDELLSDEDSYDDEVGNHIIPRGVSPSRCYFENEAPFRLISHKEVFLNGREWTWLDSGWRVNSPPHIHGPIRVRGGQMDLRYEIRLAMGLSDGEFSIPP